MLYRLFLDETGTASPNNINSANPYFILSGLIVSEEQSGKLKTKADQIKYRFWQKTNIIFHSREIGRRENHFSILGDPAIESNFHKDLFNFLFLNGVKSIIVAVNKTRATNLGWSHQDIYERAADEMICYFLKFLFYHKHKGQIIIESAGTKTDIWLYKKYIFYLAQGLPSISLSHSKAKQLLTSISFVGKNNYDIEAQVADLLAYAAVRLCLRNDGLKTISQNSYEDKMVQILLQKLITLESISSLVTLPIE